MQSVRDDIEKEHHAIQNSDIVIFFEVAQFVTSFQYNKFLNQVKQSFCKWCCVDCVSELSVNMHSTVPFTLSLLVTAVARN